MVILVILPDWTADLKSLYERWMVVGSLKRERKRLIISQLRPIASQIRQPGRPGCCDSNLFFFDVSAIFSSPISFTQGLEREMLI